MVVDSQKYSSKKLDRNEKSIASLPQLNRK